MTKQYAVYQGEELIATGTAKECAEELGVRTQSIHRYKTPSYRSRGSGKNRRDVVELIDDDDDE